MVAYIIKKLSIKHIYNYIFSTPCVTEPYLGEFKDILTDLSIYQQQRYYGTSTIKV